MISLVSKGCSEGVGENIAAFDFRGLLIFVFVTFGNRLRKDKTSKIKIAQGDARK